MESSRSSVSRLKTNVLIDAIVFAIVIGVIGGTAYLAHATRLDVVAQREALKAAQELSDRKWRQFFRSNPDVTIPKKFFARETIEEIQTKNLQIPPIDGIPLQ